jgi:hypothetical protein
MPIHQQTPSLFSTPEALAHFALPTGALHAFCLQHQPVTHAPRNVVILIEKEHERFETSVKAEEKALAPEPPHSNKTALRL